MEGKTRAGVPKAVTGNVIRDSSMGLVPETLDNFMGLHDAVWKCGSIGPALIEVIRLRNARTVNCVFCRSVRYDVAKRDGLTEDRVVQIEDGYQDSSLSKKEKLALAFADVYLRDPHSFDPTLIKELRENFTAEQIAHMGLAVGTFNAASKCAVALAGMPESLPVTEIPLPTRNHAPLAAKVA